MVSYKEESTKIANTLFPLPEINRSLPRFVLWLIYSVEFLPFTITKLNFIFLSAPGQKRILRTITNFSVIDPSRVQRLPPYEIRRFQYENWRPTDIDKMWLVNFPFKIDPLYYPHALFIYAESIFVLFIQFHCRYLRKAFKIESEVCWNRSNVNIIFVFNAFFFCFRIALSTTFTRWHLLHDIDEMAYICDFGVFHKYVFRLARYAKWRHNSMRSRAHTQKMRRWKQTNKNAVHFIDVYMCRELESQSHPSMSDLGMSIMAVQFSLFHDFVFVFFLFFSIFPSTPTFHLSAYCKLLSTFCSMASTAMTFSRCHLNESNTQHRWAHLWTIWTRFSLSFSRCEHSSTCCLMFIASHRLYGTHTHTLAALTPVLPMGYEWCAHVPSQMLRIAYLITNSLPVWWLLMSRLDFIDKYGFLWFVFSLVIFYWVLI